MGTSISEMQTVADSVVVVEGDVVTVIEVATQGPPGINPLPDLVVTDPVEGQILFFDGTNWVNRAFTADLDIVP